MMLTLCVRAGSMVQEQTIYTPSGLFLIGLVLMYAITAALHPQEFILIIYGLLYFICIPSGYLLLAIYTMVNMNNVSWGTRETGGQAAPPPPAKTLMMTQAKKCCKCPCWDHGMDYEKVPLTMVHSEIPEDNIDLNIQDNKRYVSDILRYYR